MTAKRRTAKKKTPAREPKPDLERKQALLLEHLDSASRLLHEIGGLPFSTWMLLAKQCWERAAKVAQ